MKVLTDINRGSIGASNISVLFTRDGLKSKGVATLAIQKAQEVVDNYSPNTQTIATAHGIFSEEEAFIKAVKPKFTDAIYQPDLSIKIKEGMHASPDVVCPISEVVVDIKCPYSPMTYFDNISSIKKGYDMQIQAQMLATGFTTGYLCYYLTSTKTDEYGNKIEYDIPLEERIYYHEIKEDEDLQIEMIQRVDEFLLLRDKVIKDITDVPLFTDSDFFKLCKNKKVTRLQDKLNILAWQDQIIKYNDTYYVYETKKGLGDLKKPD